MTDTNPSKELDALVRDLTRVHPMSKSEMRRRLDDYFTSAQLRLLDELMEHGSFVTYKGDGGHGVAVPVAVLEQKRQQLSSGKGEKDG